MTIFPLDLYMVLTKLYNQYCFTVYSNAYNTKTCSKLNSRENNIFAIQGLFYASFEFLLCALNIICKKWTFSNHFHTTLTPLPSTLTDQAAAEEAQVGIQPGSIPQPSPPPPLYPYDVIDISSLAGLAQHLQVSPQVMPASFGIIKCDDT